MREILEDRNLKSYKGPQYQEKDPEEKDFVETNDDIGDERSFINSSLQIAEDSYSDD